MDNYQKLVVEISEQVAKQQSKKNLKKYLIDNWIAIAALILSIVALFK